MRSVVRNYVKYPFVRTMVHYVINIIRLEWKISKPDIANMKGVRQAHHLGSLMIRNHHSVVNIKKKE
jgi:hypothetical protein